MSTQQIQIKKQIINLYRNWWIISACFFVFTFYPSTVGAANCGGTIQCQCGDTLVESQTMWYDLNDCYEHGIIIGADNITLDGNGHLIDSDDTGLGDYGIYLSDNQGIAITNCNVTEFYYGINLDGSHGNTLSDNTINNNRRWGIALSNSNNNNLFNNDLINNYVGISLLGESSYNHLINNKVSSGGVDGIDVFGNSNDNDISGNTLINNGWNGIYLEGSNNIVSGNTINDNQMVGIGVGASNSIISDNIVNNNTEVGIYLYAGDNFVMGNTVKNNYRGIDISRNFNNEISDNEFANNSYGARLVGVCTGRGFGL